MSTNATAILEQLALVEAERRRGRNAPQLAARVAAVKRYQQRRFMRSYTDLIDTARYEATTRFFLDELYGPEDYSERDAQFARVVPALVRLFPQEIIETVLLLVTLHALSERLDIATALQLTGHDAIGAADYIAAWAAGSSPAERERQIALTLELGQSLDALTRRPMLRTSLRMMRVPAAAAGLGMLQAFLEHGFDAFRQMRGAQEFLAMIGTRERRLASALFAASAGDGEVDETTLQDALQQLP